MGAWLLKRVGALAAAVWLVYYTYSSISRTLIGLFMNVSGVHLPATLACIAFGEAVLGPQARRRAAFLWGYFFCGLGAQFHYSVAILAVGGIAFDWSQQSGWRNIGKMFGSAIIAYSLSQLPYWFWLFYSADAAAAANSIGNTSGALASLATLIEWNSMAAYFTAHALMSKVMQLAPLWAVLTIAMAPRIEARIFPTLALWSAPLALYMLLIPIGMRYVFPFFLTLGLWAALAAQKIANNPRMLSRTTWISYSISLLSILGIFIFPNTIPPGWDKFIGGACILGLLFHRLWQSGHLSLAASLVTLVLSQAVFAGTVIPRPRMLPNFKMVEELSKEIHNQTGWDFAEFRKRAFFLLNHKEGSFESIYNFPTKPRSEKPWADGYFITTRLRPQNKIQDIPSLHPWIRHALETGTIQLGKPITLFPAAAIPYKIIPGAKAQPESLQNYGFPYKKIRALESLGNYELRVNDCPDRSPLCDALVSLELPKISGMARIKIDGISLSQPSEWLYPNHTLFWRGISLGFQCDGKSHMVPILDSIGFDPAYGHRWEGFLFAQHSILAPVTVRLPWPCRTKATKLKLERKFVGFADYMGGNTPLPANAVHW